MNVLVIGDVVIDRYTHGNRRGISAETPTIVANFIKEDVFVGGAGLVTRNLLRLGNTVTLLTVGNCEELHPLMLRSADPIDRFESARLSVIMTNKNGWKVSEKHRYYVEQYKLLQYDLINPGKWTPHEEDRYAEQIMYQLVALSYDAVVICDNRHGVMIEHFASKIIERCHVQNKPVYVDSQVSQAESNHHWYKGASFIFMNEIEADCAAKKIKKLKKGDAQLNQLSKFLKASIVYKRGERGAITVCQDGKTIVSEGFEVNAVDTCGAGDAFLAAFVHHGNDLEAANRWAALSTTYKGTIVPRTEDLHLRKVTR